jgi:hypothetical protein
MISGVIVAHAPFHHRARTRVNHRAAGGVADLIGHLAPGVAI